MISTIALNYTPDLNTTMSVLLAFSIVIFKTILYEIPISLCVDGLNLEWISIPLLSAERTIELLDHMGLSFLSHNGGFITIMTNYLIHFGNFVSLLDMNISILDPTILASMLPQIKCILINQEMVFDIVTNICEVYDHTDIQIEFDPNELQLQMRTRGSQLLTLYRDIEEVLGIGIENSALPTH
jgi:hypothetical protein